ncbi:MAG: helix-turn-helix transcriptional regulator [Phycisphaerales bacterium]|nr:helix-turn-helix transcriptional regulator [Phycisphaerales bacterium]
MNDLFGPTKALVGPRENPACCAAAAALLLARCEHGHPQPWLCCACSTIATLTPAEVMVSACLAEPSPDPPSWSSIAAGVGGRFGRRILDAVADDLRAGSPADDLAAALGHRAMWPDTLCARRADLTAGGQWASSGYRKWRRRLGLGEFVRFLAPLEDHLGRPRTLLIQFDGVGDAWQPDDHFVKVAGVVGACVWAAFRDRFVAPLERSEQTMALLSPIRRRIARLIISGKTETQIAEIVGRSRHTVRDHIKAMYVMLDVSTRNELAFRLSGAPRAGPPPISMGPSAADEEETPPIPEVKPGGRSARSHSPAGPSEHAPSEHESTPQA